MKKKKTKLLPPKPLTVEDLLNKPFYTVETNEEPEEEAEVDMVRLNLISNK